MSCKGDCLVQVGVNRYENKNCPNDIPCVPNKCVNYKLCGQKLPKFMEICCNCDRQFGSWRCGKYQLQEIPDTECILCKETDNCFEQPECDHPICKDCFNFIYFDRLTRRMLDIKIGSYRKSDKKFAKKLREFDKLRPKRKCPSCGK